MPIVDMVITRPLPPDVTLVMLAMVGIGMMLVLANIADALQENRKGRPPTPTRKGDDWKTPPSEPKSGWM